MRAFIALDLPDDVGEALDRLADQLAPGRHVAPDNMHLTLAFFENAGLAELEELHLHLEMAHQRHLSLTVQGVNLFGTNPPRSLHVDVTGPGLPEFQVKICASARRAGLTLPRRRFVPHITLARFSRHLPPEDVARIGRFLAAHADFALPPFVPPSMSLYQSTLGADGPRYDVLAQYGMSPRP